MNDITNTQYDDDLDKPIWGAAEIAKVINRSVRATNHLLQTGQLDAKKLAGRHVSTKRKLHRNLFGEEAS